MRGHVVVNATGVWTDEIQALSKQRGRFRVRASKGVHVVVPRDRIVSEVAIILRTEKSVLFVIPWGTHWIIGTTDTDWNLDLAHPAATKADIDYILDHVNAVLATQLTHDDIDGVYAGLRPLLAGESEETSKLSREHAVATPAPGLVAIAGGKYTTYRVMAADAVDAAAEFIPARVAPSITEKVPLVGADGYFALVNQTEHVGARYGLHPYRVRHLLDRYGSLIDEVLALAEGDPDLLTPITDAPVYLKVEAAYAAAAEGALHLEDILARRTRISIEYPHRGVDCAREVAEVVAPVAGLEPRRRRPGGRDLHRPGRGRGALAGPARRRLRRRAAGRGARSARRDPRTGAPQLVRRSRSGALPVRDGLGPARVRLHGGVGGRRAVGGPIRSGRRAKVLAGEVVTADGTVVDEHRRCWRPAAMCTSTVTCPTRCRCRSTSRSCTATTTSWWSTSRTSWPPCRAAGTWRRRRWCGCVVSSTCPS